MSTITDSPAGHLAPEAVDAILRAAVLAPSSHNTQPWTFAVAPGVIQVRADRTRALPVNDPDDRELVMSCGAALFNLLVATRQAGGEPAVELLPDAADRDLLATVLLHGRGDPRAEVDRLHAAIELRRTHRGTFVDRALPAGLHDELRACARAEGAWLELLDDDARDRLADLIAEGDRMQWANRHWRRELAAWLHPRRKGDGLVMPELFAPLAHAAVMTLDIGMPAAARDRDRARQAPAIVVLDTRCWAGRASHRPSSSSATPRNRPSRRHAARWPRSWTPPAPDSRGYSVLLRSAQRATDGCPTGTEERSSWSISNTEADQ
jgi:hypothetical protein